MATQYLCDVCGKPALSKDHQDESNGGFVPEIKFQGLRVQIYIKRPEANEAPRFDKRRDEMYGDLCRECLLKAIGGEDAPLNGEGIAFSIRKGAWVNVPHLQPVGDWIPILPSKLREIEADAQLGALVRTMPALCKIGYCNSVGNWFIDWLTDAKNHCFATPEDALRREMQLREEAKRKEGNSL